jgi:hypothetical protein
LLAYALEGFATEQPREDGRRERDHAVEHGDIEHSALPGAFAFAERCQNRDHRPEAAADVCQLKAGHLREALGGPLDAEHPGASQVVQIVPGVSAERARLPVSGERTDDELGIGLVQQSVPDPEPVEHARTELLEQNVIARQEAQQHAFPGFVLQVEDEAPFAAIQSVKERALPGDRGARDARVVSAVRSFHLVHLRSEIREHERRDRARQEPRQIEDAYAFEGGHAPYGFRAGAASWSSFRTTGPRLSGCQRSPLSVRGPGCHP